MMGGQGLMGMQGQMSEKRRYAGVDRESLKCGVCEVKFTSRSQIDVHVHLPAHLEKAKVERDQLFPVHIKHKHKNRICLQRRMKRSRKSRRLTFQFPWRQTAFRPCGRDLTPYIVHFVRFGFPPSPSSSTITGNLYLINDTQVMCSISLHRGTKHLHLVRRLQSESPPISLCFSNFLYHILWWKNFHL